MGKISYIQARGDGIEQPGKERKSRGKKSKGWLKNVASLDMRGTEGPKKRMKVQDDHKGLYNVQVGGSQP